jgi:hypothetical protein
MLQIWTAGRTVKWQLQILLGSFPVNEKNITFIDRPNKEGAFDTAIPLAHNIQTTITENQRKYQDLTF